LRLDSRRYRRVAAFGVWISSIPPRVAGTREPGHDDCTQWSGPRDSSRSTPFLRHALNLRLDSRRYRRVAAFGVWISSIPPRVAGIREPGHGDCTQWSGPRDSLVQRPSFGTHSASGWTVAATGRQPCLRQTMSDQAAAGRLPKTMHGN